MTMYIYKDSVTRTPGWWCERTSHHGRRSSVFTQLRNTYALHMTMYIYKDSVIRTQVGGASAPPIMVVVVVCLRN